MARGTDQETSYNVNADTAAAKIAVAVGAEKLILLTDVRGLLVFLFGTFSLFTKKKYRKSAFLTRSWSRCPRG